jgi:hypothetical protein
MRMPRILFTIACLTGVIGIVGALASIELAKVKLLNRDSWILFGGGSEWFWGFLQFAIVAVTLAFIYGQLHLSTASHILQSMTALNERWNAERQSSLRRKVCAAWIGGDKSFNSETQAVFYFFEELGLYVDRQWIPSSVIWELYSWHVESYWAMFSEEVARLRNYIKDPSLFENFEKLVREMHVISRRRGIPANSCDPGRLSEFADWEVRVNQDGDRTSGEPNASTGRPASPSAR